MLTYFPGLSHHFIIDVAGEEEGEVGGTIVEGMKADEVVAGKGLEVFCLGKASAGVVGAINGATEQAARHYIAPLTTYEVLAQIVLADYLEAIVGKGRMQQHVAYQPERIGYMAAKGVESDKAMMDGNAEFEPCAEVVKAFGQLSGRMAVGALAQ